ncbi:hypothetical protein FG93_00155 [Bosea sp. LC85]|nr:hypothetical protein FG93_00155 [Bosea sp. LC85]
MTARREATPALQVCGYDLTFCVCIGFPENRNPLFGPML